MNEFSVIRRFFHRPLNHPDVALGIGDDAALVDTLPGRQWAICTDTMVEGVHFLPTAPADSVGWKAVAVNLSDLAAMGATPVWITLALTLPRIDTAWLDAFSQGLFALCDTFHVDLIGGDLTSGPLCITIQAGGHVPKGSALRRGGAQVDDLICVTGTLGDAGAGLTLARHLPEPTTPDHQFLISRLQRPTPRITAGIRLRGLATACIDISDGLLADLGHLLAASHRGAIIDAAVLPLSNALNVCFPDQAQEFALTSGDDYELCFTIPGAHLDTLRQEFQSMGVSLTPIGRITADPGLHITHRLRTPAPDQATGFLHFN